MGEKIITGTDPAKMIREALAEEGMNQSQLADIMGVSRQNVSEFLNRPKKNSMRYDSFSRMAKSLGYEVILRKYL